MPEPAAGLCDAGQLASAIGYVSEALALVCSRAPATEVALTAVVLRDLIAEFGRLGLAAEILRDHGDERYADGIEDGIEIGRAQILAAQAAERRSAGLPPPASTSSASTAPPERTRSCRTPPAAPEAGQGTRATALTILPGRSRR